MTRDASQATFVAERCSQDPDLNVRQQAEPLRVFLLSESVGELPDTVLPANTSRSTPIDDRERDKLIAQLGEPSHSQCTTDFELGKAYGAREQAARKLAHAPLDESHKQALMVVARDPYVYARLAAVETLASSFAADQDVRDFLMERSAVDTEWDSGDDVGEEIRGAILIALARGRSGDEKVYSWILERSETDPGADVRCDALEALAVGWPDSPETIERLIRLAETAEISERCRAIKILARSWPQQPKVRACLHRVVERVGEVLGAAATALPALSCYGQGELELLHFMAREDPRPALRFRAAELLTEVHRDHPQTRNLIVERTREEDNPQARTQMVQLLAAVWPAM